MQIRSKNALFVAAVASLLGSAAYGATITQWNFNSNPADTLTTTGTLTPSIGSGTASLVGGTTATFASGASGTGSSDPVTVDDTGWNTSGYPAAAAGDKTAGAQYLVSTLGFEDIIVNYDLRHSNTSSRFEQVQYTVNGTTWVDAPSGLFDATPGDTWYNNRTVNLSSITAVDNISTFGLRVVSTFAPSTSAYAASTTTSTYGTTGTWRFDMVTVSGTSTSAPSSFVTLTNAGTPTLGTLSIVGGSGSYTPQNVATSGDGKSGVLGISGNLAASTDPIWVYLDLATASQNTLLTALTLGSPSNLTAISDVTVTIGGITYDKLLQFNNTVATNDFFAFDFNSLNGGAGVSINNIAVVPEPATFGLLTVGGLALLARRRRA